MIELRISGETAQDFAAQLATVAQLMAGTAAPAAATTTGRGKKSTTSSEGATSSEGQSSAAGEAAGGTGAASGPVTRDSVAAKCTQYSQKGGVAALKELLVSAGAANGKWSEIADDKLEALNARLDDLLA